MGARLFWREDPGPSEEAPVLLLSNSLAADIRMWDPQVKLLTQRYRLLRYDTRGHGRSDAPEGPYSFDMLVADAIAVLDGLGVAKAAMMGLSLGGMTGLGVALAHPGRLERLVCCDARADAPEAFVKSWDDRLSAVRRGGMQAILMATLDRWLVPDFRASNPATVGWVSEMILGTPVAGWAGCVAALKGLSYLADLHRITIPTLFVVGAEDAGAPPAVMRDMASRVPGSSLVEIPNAAHLPNLDNQPAFEEAIRGFLGLG
jgi:3-oxoadipate enol-lactonase